MGFRIGRYVCHALFPPAWRYAGRRSAGQYFECKLDGSLDPATHAPCHGDVIADSGSDVLYRTTLFITAAIFFVQCGADPRRRRRGSHSASLYLMVALALGGTDRHRPGLSRLELAQRTRRTSTYRYPDGPSA